MKQEKELIILLILCLCLGTVHFGLAQNSAVEWFQKGTTAQNPDQKIEAYLKSIELDPNLVEAHYNLAYVYKNKDDYRKALESFNTAWKLSQDENDNKIKVSILYELGICYKRLDNYSKAMSTLENAKELARDNKVRAPILYELGRIAIQQEAFDLALNYFEEGLQIAKQKKQLFKIALETANKEKQLDALYKQGLQLSAEKKYQEALKIFSQIIESDPNYKDVNIRLAELQSQEQANQKVATGAKADKLMQEANGYFLQKNYHTAIERYQAVTKISPFNSKCYYNMGQCYERLKNNELAIAAYQKALLIKSNFADARSALARLGGKALEEEVKDASFSRANSLFLQKKYDEAITEYENFLKKEPLNYQAQYNIGYCYEQKGELEQAQQHYQNALKMNENSQEASQGIDRIKSQLTEKQLASLKQQIDDDVDYERYVLARTRLTRYLQLAPNDKWARDKAEVVTKALEKQKAAVEKQETKLVDFDKDTVITAKESPVTPPPPTQVTPKESSASGDLLWLYIVVGLVLLGIIIFLVTRKKKSAPEAPVIATEIEDTNVHTCLTDCHSARKTGILLVDGKNGAGEKIEGKIHIRNGNIIRAQCNDTSGVDALHTLLTTKIPDKMAFQETQFNIESNIHQATMPLLVQWQMKKENE